MTASADYIVEFQDIESRVLMARKRLDLLSELTPALYAPKTIFDEEVDDYFEAG